MTHWYSVHEKMPTHLQKVIALTKNGHQHIVIFLEEKSFRDGLEEKGINTKNNPFIRNEFCSTEIAGNVLKDVIYLHPHIPPPEKH